MYAKKNQSAIAAGNEFSKSKNKTSHISNYIKPNRCPHYNAPARHSHGFSLIELLLILTITGIIMSAAIPAYSSYTAIARTSMATMRLSQIAMALERHYGEDKSYELSISDLQLNDNDQWFQYAIQNDDPHSYQITATPRADVMIETVLRLDHFGRNQHRLLGTLEWQPGWPQ